MKYFLTAILSIPIVLSAGSFSAQTFSLEKVSGTPLILEDDIIGNIADMTKVENGHFYLADDRQHTIWVADLSGNVIQRIGQEGAGPGELSRPSSLAVDGDRVIVLDTGNNRISVFSTDGTYETDFRIDLITPPSGLTVGPEGQITVSTIRDEPRLTVYDTNGIVIREIGTDKPPFRPMRINFNHMSGSSGGQILYSPVNRYEVYRVDWDGTILNTYQAEPAGYSPLPTTPTQGRTRVTPIFRPLFANDHLLVQRAGITDNDEFKRFLDLFALDGNHVQLGIELPIMFHFSNGEDLYGIDTTSLDEGEDNPYIVMYRLNRGP